MKRRESIRTLYTIGEKIAKEWGLNEIKNQDISCGIWDEVGMSDYLVQKYGDMKEVVFHDGKTGVDGRMNLSVECGYRFSNPRLCILGRDDVGRQTLASIELSDGIWIDGEYTHNEDYRPSVFQAWGIEGYKMLGRLLQEWESCQ